MQKKMNEIKLPLFISKIGIMILHFLTSMLEFLS